MRKIQLLCAIGMICSIGCESALKFEAECSEEDLGQIINVDKSFYKCEKSEEVFKWIKTECKNGELVCKNGLYYVCKEAGLEKTDKSCKSNCDSLEGKNCKDIYGLNVGFYCENSELKPCTNSAPCVADVLGDVCGECRDGQEQCGDNVIKICENSRWVPKECGSDEHCSDEDGNVQCVKNEEPVENVCENEKKRCHPKKNGIQVCQRQEWVDANECNDNQHCVLKDDSVECINDGPEDNKCLEGQKRCEGKKLQTCVNGVWEANTCSENEVCINERCQDVKNSCLGYNENTITVIGNVDDHPCEACFGKVFGMIYTSPSQPTTLSCDENLLKNIKNIDNLNIGSSNKIDGCYDNILVKPIEKNKYSIEYCPNGCDANECKTEPENPCDRTNNNELYCPKGKEDDNNICLGSKYYKITGKDCETVVNNIKGKAPTQLSSENLLIDVGCYYVIGENNTQIDFSITKPDNNYLLDPCTKGSICDGNACITCDEETDDELFYCPNDKIKMACLGNKQIFIQNKSCNEILNIINNDKSETFTSENMPEGCYYILDNSLGNNKEKYFSVSASDSGFNNQYSISSCPSGCDPTSNKCASKCKANTFSCNTDNKLVCELEDITSHTPTVVIEEYITPEEINCPKHNDNYYCMNNSDSNLVNDICKCDAGINYRCVRGLSFVCEEIQWELIADSILTIKPGEQSQYFLSNCSTSESMGTIMDDEFNKYIAYVLCKDSNFASSPYCNPIQDGNFENGITINNSSYSANSSCYKQFDFILENFYLIPDKRNVALVLRSLFPNIGLLMNSEKLLICTEGCSTGQSTCN